MNMRFDAIGTVVSDMAASVAFYRRLGLVFPQGAEVEGHVEAGLPGGMRLFLDTEEMVRSFRPGWRAESGARAELKPWDAVWGQRYAVVLDPDDNGVDLFAPLSS